VKKGPINVISVIKRFIKIVISIFIPEHFPTNHTSIDLGVAVAYIPNWCQTEARQKNKTIKTNSMTKDD